MSTTSGSFFLTGNRVGSVFNGGGQSNSKGMSNDIQGLIDEFHTDTSNLRETINRKNKNINGTGSTRGSQSGFRVTSGNYRATHGSGFGNLSQKAAKI